MEDIVFSVPGNAEQAEAMIADVALAGNADDWAKHDNRYLTKPNAWRKSCK
jgi:hypothetical protein